MEVKEIKKKWKTLEKKSWQKAKDDYDYLNDQLAWFVGIEKYMDEAKKAGK